MQDTVRPVAVGSSTDQPAPLLHRRFAYAVNAPAMLRHVMFRMGKEKNAAFPHPLRTQSEPETHAARQQLFEEIASRLKSLPGDVSTIDWRNSILVELTGLPAAFQEWRVRVLADVYSEHFSLTYVLDQPAEATKPSAISVTEKALARASPTDINLDVGAFTQNHYETIWDDFDNHFANFVDYSTWPGDNICEFRGFVLRDMANRFAPSDRRERTEHGFIREVSEKGQKGSFHSLHGWVNRNSILIKQILQFDHERLPTGTDADANCVVCDVLDGDGVYCSSLAQFPLRADSRSTKSTKRFFQHAAIPHEPLRYFVLYNGRSRFQLGRYLRQTHILGELRHAALIDLDRLEKADMRMRETGNYLDTIMREKESKGEYPTLGKDELEKVLFRLNGIVSSDIPGGLIFRINRSRYYADAFRERLPIIGVKRIAGWESYEDFVRRNLYYYFDFIDGIGKRYEALSSRAQRLIAVSNDQNMQGLVTEMNKVDQHILRIQELGEIIGFTALTYYGGKVIATIVAEEAVRRPFAIVTDVVVAAAAEAVSLPLVSPSIGPCEKGVHLQPENICLSIMGHNYNVEAFAMLFIGIVAAVFLVVARWGRATKQKQRANMTPPRVTPSSRTTPAR